MTFWATETAASATAPRWPAKAAVTKLMENWKTDPSIAGPAMCHVFFDSSQLLERSLSMIGMPQNDSLFLHLFLGPQRRGSPGLRSLLYVLRMPLLTTNHGGDSFTPSKVLCSPSGSHLNTRESQYQTMMPHWLLVAKNLPDKFTMISSSSTQRLSSTWCDIVHGIKSFSPCNCVKQSFSMEILSGDQSSSPNRD